MQFGFYDDALLPSFAQTEVLLGRCFIQRFFGQTRIYLPQHIGLVLGKQNLQHLIETVFPPILVYPDDTRINFGSDGIFLELPSVLPCSESSTQYQKPDTLVQLIMEEFQKNKNKLSL